MLLKTIRQLSRGLKEKNLCLATAESCTGGLLAASMTELPGASDWFDCALVTYSNQIKQSLLNVSVEVLEQYGAVSEACALAMLAGLWQKSAATVGVAITGIAGPEGGSVAKPVGLVHFALGLRNQDAVTKQQIFHGTRRAIRRQAVIYALEQLIQFIYRT